jgi:L-seryl-tRNA(Ser) seleniumtransferase
VLACLRALLEEQRTHLRQDPTTNLPDLLSLAQERLALHALARLQGVLNATGVLIHTNLGRAPLSQKALEAIQEAALGYSNLEFQLGNGRRGSRHSYVARLLAELTGAEAALVTNNNAAAMLLLLSTFAQGREVIISRGELVEIGGGFRIPDVLRQSGCTLVEVGTTNRTRIQDYERAITDQTAALLVVHPSNFRVLGFTEQVELADLARLGAQYHIPVFHDLGSGCLLDTSKYGLAHEPQPQESIAAGVDLVCFSGDKLLGGPQAGLIAGRQKMIDQLARHPLMRAIRMDKLTLAALTATLEHYQRHEAEQMIPLWQMLSASPVALHQRVESWIQHLQKSGFQAQMESALSTIGGGSLPGETLPTYALTLAQQDLSCSLDELALHLRQAERPVIGRISHDRLYFDPRTIFPHQDEQFIATLLQSLQSK